MLIDMWMVADWSPTVFGSDRAVRNAAAVLEAHRTALAEVDSVVDRLQRHAAVRPAA